MTGSVQPMRHTRWFTILLTLALLATLAFVAAVLTNGAFPAYFTVSLIAWLLTLGVQRAFSHDGGGFGNLDNALREGRTEAAKLEALYGRPPNRQAGSNRQRIVGSR